MWPFSRPSPRGFYSREKIILSIRESNNFNPDESLETAGGFVIHEEAGERTWLVATKLRIYSILDDRRKIDPWINWSLSRSRIFSEGKFMLDIKSRPLDEKTGLVDIGYRKDNPYTRGLFKGEGITEKIKALILEKMWP